MDTAQDVMSEEELDRIADGIGGGDDPEPDDNDQGTTKEPEDDLETLDTKALAAKLKKLETLVQEKDDHISRLNEESKSRRLKLKEYEEADEEKKKAEMDEITRLKAELEEATSSLNQTQTELRTMRVRNEVRKLEVTSDEKAYMLIDPEDFSLPEDKDFEAIPKELEALFKAKPHYFREAQADQHLSDDGTPRESGKGKKRRKPIELPKQKL